MALQSTNLVRPFFHSLYSDGFSIRHVSRLEHRMFAGARCGCTWWHHQRQINGQAIVAKFSVSEARPRSKKLCMPGTWFRDTIYAANGNWQGHARLVKLAVSVTISVILLCGVNGAVAFCLALASGFPSSTTGGGENGSGGTGGTGGGRRSWGEGQEGAGPSSYDSSSSFSKSKEDDKQKTENPDIGERQVAFVIPTLNEASSIVATLEALRTLSPPPSQIIVVDGGSTDDTVLLASSAGAIAIRSPCRGRSVQMNHGAWHAIRNTHSPDALLCFLHSDTAVPRDMVRIIRATMREERGVVCAALIPLLVTPDRTLWSVSLRNVVKTWLYPLAFMPLDFFRGLRILFGDQVMFCRMKDFKDVGGFNEALAIMEDADLCIRFNRKRPNGHSRIAMVNRLVITSGRRIVKIGLWRSSLINFRIGLSYGLGAPAEEVNALYRKLYAHVR